jgi:hypothetical protein
MSDVSADVSPSNGIAIGPSAPIEVTGTVHSTERPTVCASKAATAVKSTAATKSAATPPRVGGGKKGRKTNKKSGENNYQAESETGCHDTRLRTNIGFGCRLVSAMKQF